MRRARMVKRKKPTIKELNNVVIENRQGIEIAFKSIEELRVYISGIDRLFDWYVEFKEDIDDFKKYIEKNKVPEQKDSDGTKDSISDRREDVLEEEPSEVVSEETK